MKFPFYCLLIFGIQTSLAQRKPLAPSIQAQVHQATTNYLKNYFSENEIKQYVQLVDSLSTVSLKMPLHQVDKNEITANMISKIEVNVAMKLPGYSDYLTLELNNKFDVKENIAYYRNNENLTALRINSIKQYIDFHQHHQILSSDTVFNYIKQTYPNQQWNKPNISRGSFPPYSFYYEALETNCSKCKQVRIKLNELNKIGGNEVEMIPLK